MFAGSTAEGAALLRAAGALLRDRNLRGPDRLAADMIPWALRASALVKVPVIRRIMPWAIERRMPGSVWFELARTKYMDDVLRAELAAGTTQVVLLGAGFDTRAYRMPELTGANVFEVDHPVTAARKQARLRGRDIGHVRYVTIDFNREDLATRLAANGYDSTAKSVVIWSGVAPYLPAGAVSGTLRWMSTQAPDSCLVFDYVWQELVDGQVATRLARTLLKAVNRQGEPFRSGIPRGRTTEFLAEHGLAVQEDNGPDSFDPYVTRTDGSAVGPVWDFGGIVRCRVPQ
ncbi:SAM-dependent methyltransferase [Pseudonocardiaceae bacterium YIM PH 21723]|nr:SAM-dependent methyltransferase [Pseudonocardiaceae bacterium YIM PH 21723]